MGPGAILVRVVGLEDDVAWTDAIKKRHTDWILEEATPDLPVIVGGGRFGTVQLRVTPASVGQPHVIGSLEQVGDPADLAFREEQFELREAFENTGEHEIGHPADAVAEEDGRRNCVRCVGRRLWRLGARTHVHADDGPSFLADPEKWIPVARVDAGEAQKGRELAEGHSPNPASRVASHFGYSEINAPKRDEAQGQQPALARTAPLLHHPVVVRLDTQQREAPVFAPQELLPAESGVVGETELGLHSVETHVLQTSLGLPTARTHLVIGDSLQYHFLGREARRGDGALHRGPMILVAPPGNRRPVGAGSLDIGRPFEFGHSPGHVLDMRAGVASMGWKAAGPHVWGFDHVRIKVHDPGDLVDVRFQDGRHRVYYIQLAHEVELQAGPAGGHQRDA